MPAQTLNPSLKDSIAAQLSPKALVVDPEAIKAYCTDASGLNFMPEMVVRAQTVADIQALLRMANLHRFPVIPRGGGSGLAGACLAVAD